MRLKMTDEQHTPEEMATILTHREQRGANVTKASRGVRRIRGNPQRKLSRLRRVMRVGVEATAGNTRLCRVQNITHRSDLASLCVPNKQNTGKGAGDE